MIKYALHFTFFGIVIAGLIACSPKFQIELSEFERGQPVTDSERHNLLKQIADKNSQSPSFKLLTRAQIQSGDDLVTVRYVIIYDAPDRLRVEVVPLNSFITLQLLILNDQEGWLFDRQEKRAAFSKSPEKLIQKVLHLPLSTSALAALFSGRVLDTDLKVMIGAPDTSKGELLRSRNDLGENVIALLNPNSKAEYILDQNTLRPLIHLRRESESAYPALIGSYTWSAGKFNETAVLRPKLNSIQLRFPQEDVALSLEYVGFEENIDKLDQALFDPKAVYGFKEFSISSLDSSLF